MTGDLNCRTAVRVWFHLCCAHLKLICKQTSGVWRCTCSLELWTHCADVLEGVWSSLESLRGGDLIRGEASLRRWPGCDLIWHQNVSWDHVGEQRSAEWFKNSFVGIKKTWFSLDLSWVKSKLLLNILFPFCHWWEIKPFLWWESGIFPFVTQCEVDRGERGQGAMCQHLSCRSLGAKTNQVDQKQRNKQVRLLSASLYCETHPVHKWKMWQVGTGSTSSAVTGRILDLTPSAAHAVALDVEGAG